MNEPTNLEQPARMEHRASSLGEMGKGEEVSGKGEDALRALVVPVWSDLMEWELTPAARSVAWTILSWSLKLGRMATLPFTVQDLERRTGVGHANVIRALKDLKGFAMIRRCGDGWQLVPQSKLHRWGGRRRLVDSSQLETALRIDAAQGCDVSAADFPAMEEPRLDVALAEVTVAGAVAAEKQEIGNRRLEIWRGEGGDGTGGGAKNFLPAGGIESKPSRLPAPLKALVPPPSPLTLSKDTLNTLKREPGIISIPRQIVAPLGTPEAGMDGEDYLDPHALDEKTLMARLKRALGEEGRDGMKAKGGRWRMRIRGTINAADDPTTAEAMRYALNEFDRRKAEGKPVDSAGGFLYGEWMDYCTQHGWKLVWNAQQKPQWERCAPFSFHGWRQSQKRSAKTTPKTPQKQPVFSVT
ncbi:MAG: hypothetical protein HZC54_00775 [Verrucomicrobia bacterium]|nr:hypothetical protein [Verrucomicrobiota bacterium]